MWTAVFITEMVILKWSLLTKGRSGLADKIAVVHGIVLSVAGTRFDKVKVVKLTFQRLTEFGCSCKG